MGGHNGNISRKFWSLNDNFFNVDDLDVDNVYYIEDF